MTGARAQSFVAEWSTDDIERLGPTGMAMDTIGGVTYLYVADQNHGRIIKFNAATGERVAVWGEVGTGDLQFNSPFGIAINPGSHDLYIAERGSNRVQCITNTGAFVMKWGIGGTGAGEFNQPVGIAADSAGNVYVVDHGNNRVQKFRVFNGTATPVGSWGGLGSGAGQLNAPYGMTLDAKGVLWVADAGNHRLSKFDLNGNFVGVVGTYGTGDGQFDMPVWVNFDAAGNYYVTETNSDPQNVAAADIANQRVQKFSPTGAFQLKWGTYGEAGGQFRLPFDVLVDPAGYAYVSDYYNTRVQKFNLNASAPPPQPTPPPTGATTTRIINLSSRLGTVDGDTSRAFIAGFAVSGTGPKAMLVRAVGPGLAAYGVSNPLANPALKVFSGANVVAQNDDWNNDPAVASASTKVGAFALAPGSKDAALVVTLNPGVYSAQVVANGGQGVALVEVYDIDSAQPAAELVNLSTRGFVDTGDGVLVAGFVVNGSTPKRLLVRGIGPALGSFGVSGALTDSALKLFSGSTLVAQNDDWNTPVTVAGGSAAATGADIAAAAQTVGAFALPSGSKDAAVLVTLPPGNYSAVVSGGGGATGAGLVEVYELPNQ